jgi:Domain of unknown function (DUF5615)
MSESSPSPRRRIDNPLPSGSYRGQEIKIFLDEMLAPDIAKALTALGIKANAVRSGQNDEALIQQCLTEARVLVTKNHDAVYRAAKAGAKVVYLHFRKGQDGGYVGQTLRIFGQLQAWDGLLTSFPGESVDSFASYCGATSMDEIAKRAEQGSLKRQQKAKVHAKRRRVAVNRETQVALDL